MTDRSTIRNLTRHSILVSGLVITFSAFSLSSAMAFSSNEECLESVRDTEFALVQADVTNEQLNEIADNLTRVQSLCENGELDNAATEIDVMSDIINQASAN